MKWSSVKTIFPITFLFWFYKCVHVVYCCPCIAERTPTPKVPLNPLLIKWTGAQESFRLAHPPPSASWTCTGASAPSSYLRGPGPPGNYYSRQTVLHVNSDLSAKCYVFMFLLCQQKECISLPVQPFLTSDCCPSQPVSRSFSWAFLRGSRDPGCQPGLQNVPQGSAANIKWCVLPIWTGKAQSNDAGNS